MPDYSRLSPSDRDHLLGELLSPGVDRLLLHVQELRETAIAAVMAGNQEDFEKLRGRVQGYDQVLQLRQDLEDELRQEVDDE